MLPFVKVMNIIKTNIYKIFGKIYGYKVSFNNLIYNKTYIKISNQMKFRLNLKLLQSMITMFKSIITIIIVHLCFKT